MISPDGFAINPRIPPNWRICCELPRAPESAIMKIDGSYVAAARFINSLERSKMFFLVSSVNLGEAQGGNVKLRLKLATYRRVGA